MLTKQEIRSRRQAMRTNMKKSMQRSELGKNLEFPDNCLVSNALNEEKCKSKSRKPSEQFNMTHDILCFNQIQTQDKFEDLFRKQKKLGEGAQSVVYKCVQKSTQKLFAVKTIRNSQPETISKLKEQYRILRRLNHESIVKAHFLFVDQEQSSVDFVIELCQCLSLADYIKTKGPLRENQCARIVTQIGNAICYLHENGVCHRDLKPQNIMYDQEKQIVKIIDFEIAKAKRYQNQKIQMWTNTGTLRYKAPEMFGGCYNEAVDVWALGIITYQLISNEIPFDSCYQQDLIKKITNQDPEFSKLVFTKQCQAFIRKCLAKSPVERIKIQQLLRQPFLLKNSRSGSSRGSLKRAETISYNAQDGIVDTESPTFHEQNSKFAGIDQLGEDMGIRVIE